MGIAHPTGLQGYCIYPNRNTEPDSDLHFANKATKLWRCEVRSHSKSFFSPKAEQILLRCCLTVVSSIF
ncbi:hypothetical protein PJF56_08840 [Roseofilum sp. BLCC_M91]|uniref:Uncharacterized protein n=1 Tax=Roseofilum halophilum BLCC-M91 TaxID=3022259 RepID=A0ABT7BIF4_9CYAN|nr:hypothetical protein [Roseofilum halophilum]MDJ1178968.1 hypothetical protein [Roseofilum halophilum BLCC-M91]